MPFGAGTHFIFMEKAGGGSGTLSLTDGALRATITFLGNYSTGNFKPMSDGQGGTLFEFHA